MPDPATDPATDPDTRPVNPPGSLTLLLHRAHAGDPAAGDAAYRQLYPELLKIARARLRVHRAPTLLDTEALVHESFLRFVRSGHFQPDSRKHFYAYAAQAMRHIVIDFARRSAAERRGGALEQVTFDTDVVHQLPQPQPVLDVDRALASLQALDPLLAELVEMRFYGGYTEAEIAKALGVSDRTVRRHWDKARAFLLMELQGP
jgi:RNA polymerase sigma factor (TIGR02999 family)